MINKEEYFHTSYKYLWRVQKHSKYAVQPKKGPFLSQNFTEHVVTEGGRGIFNTLPYSYLPFHINICLIYFIVMWLNALSTGKGISQKYSLREIVIGHHLDFKNNA